MNLMYRKNRTPTTLNTLGVKGTAAALVGIVLAAILSTGPSSAQESRVTVNPTEHFEVVRTPGAGFQDFVGFLPSDDNLARCHLEGGPLSAPDTAGLDSGSIYLRLLWQDIQPAEGVYNWGKIDRIFECAKQQGKTVDFRVMLSYPAKGQRNCLDGGTEDDNATHGIPCWLVRKGVNELFYSNSMDRAIVQDTYLPDWEDPTLRRYHAELIWAVAGRYGSNPRLNSVDIGSAGLWGEWHTFPDASLMPSNVRAKEIVDLYANAFPDTPLVVLAEVFKNDLANNSEVADHLRSNYAGRYGWRGDSWGGLGHHNYDYRPISAANPNLWKTGPIAMEVTGVMNEWAARQDGSGSYGSVLPIGEVTNDALTWHSSLAHNKASKIPAAFSNQLAQMAVHAGPRLVLDRLTYPGDVVAGSSFDVATSWRNRGVAPLYRDFRIAFRFQNADGAEQIVTTSQTMKGLLPTDALAVDRNVTVPIPADMQGGAWTLDVGVVFHSDSSLRMPIAIMSSNDLDWYRMGSIGVVAADDGNGTVDGAITTMTATAPSGSGAPSAIVDGDGATSWSNRGVAAAGYFDVSLGSIHAVSKIRYQDDYARDLRISIDGTVVFEGWTSNAGENTWSDIDIAPTTGRTMRFELRSGSWLVPDEVQVVGIDQRVGGLTATAPGGSGSPLSIIDGDSGTYWSNQGVAAVGYFEIDLGSTHAVSKIRYQDNYARDLRISIDGAVIFDGWTSSASTFAEIDVPRSVAGRRLRFELRTGAWLVPKEVEIYGAIR